MRFAILATLLAGCGSSSLPLVVATIDGTNTFVGVVASETKVAAYVCDGQKLGAWFTGAVSGGKTFALETSQGNLNGTLAADTISGTFTATTAGTGARSFSGPRVAANGTAGLWRLDQTVSGTSLFGGVVLKTASEQRGIAKNRVTGMIMPSPMIMPDPMGIKTSISFGTTTFDLNRILVPDGVMAEPM